MTNDRLPKVTAYIRVKGPISMASRYALRLRGIQVIYV